MPIMNQVLLFAILLAGVVATGLACLQRYRASRRRLALVPIKRDEEYRQ